jgi:hypothetical protein
MKVLTVHEATEKLDGLCEEALAGEVIRLQLADGSLLELTPVPVALAVAALSQEQITQCYGDTEWADFENHCGKAST